MAAFRTDSSPDNLEASAGGDSSISRGDITDMIQEFPFLLL